MTEANNPKKKWHLRFFKTTALGLVFIVLMAFFSFIFLVFHTFNNPPKNHEIKETVDAAVLAKIEGSNNSTLGGAEAKITIVEFADFACPLCKNSFTTIREISKKYKNDVKIVFRDFPVISSFSLNLSLAAYCAGDQGLFWIMHDKLFQNQGIKTKEELFKLASDIGVEGSAFTTCYDKEKYLNKIYSNYSDGLSLEISGTPTFFINGSKVAGDMPLEDWYKIIDYILAK